MSVFNLYINGTPADLPEAGVTILFQKQRTNYSNPTIVKNAFTKTVTLPGTKTNNQIFNDLWKLDRLQWSGGFNPSKRTPFILMKDGGLVEKGYLKLDNVVKAGGFYSYECTLYGELGNVLYGLSYKNVNDEQIPMTLGDLDFGFSQFTISRNLIQDCWNRLGGDNTASQNADTLNFMVGYEGAPGAENFDPKKIWTEINRTASVYWKDSYNNNVFPDSYTDGSTEYGTVNSAMTRMEAQEQYGLMELKSGLSPIETRDLRSYLLRPVLRIRKLFEAIGSYLSSTTGYSLDITDPHFATDEFNDCWMTLSMLWEIEPAVESNMTFTMRDLLKNTGSPASYLVSYCKTYGIYLDVDYVNKKLILTRLPRFFTGVTKELLVDEGKDVKIDPLSFDKASYTFDYGEGYGDLYKKYKDNFGIKYGSRKVNTGYEFDASTAPYIDNNIFKGAVDCIEEGPYYRYSYRFRAGGPNPEAQGTTRIEYPVALMNQQNPPVYKLFELDSNLRPTPESSTTDGEMTFVEAKYWPVGHTNGFDTRSGYQFQDVSWTGLSKDVYRDGFPKVQFHKEDNKAGDGKDVLVWFGGMMQTRYGYVTVNPNDYSTTFTRYTPQDYEYVRYLLTDDAPKLKLFIGKNAYLDCPNPDYSSPGGNDHILVITSLPMFTRGRYTVSGDHLSLSGGKYQMTDTIDFGITQESYVPETSIGANCGIYNKYWNDYISDVYSVNTRVMDCYCYLDNIDEVFREFYHYDNALWILSKVEDWDMDTHLAKATFIKVNDKTNYTA